MERPTIIYFDIRARAEPIRLILEEMAIAYDDQQITDDQWLDLRPTTPFGWLPCYRDGESEVGRATPYTGTWRGCTISMARRRRSAPAVM